MSKPKKLSTQQKRKLNRNSGRASSSQHPLRSVNLGTLFPDRVITQMVYADTIYRTTALPYDERQFLINSTFDPDSTGTGHQPMGRDQLLGNIYNKYRVHSVKARLNFVTLYNGYVPNVLYVVPANDNSALTGNLNVSLEQPMGWHSFAPFGAAQPQYSRNIKLWDLWGKTKEQYLSDDITAANYTTSPVEVMYLKVGALSADGATSVVYGFTIHLDMVVECFDRFTQPQS